MIDYSIIGKKFGKLTVIEFSHQTPEYGKKSSYWKCKCDCGKYKTVRRINLTGKAATKSCGCLRQEAKKIIGDKQRGIPRSKLTNGEAGFRLLLARYKKHGEEFTISDLEFYAITQQSCFYCGIPPSQMIEVKVKGVTEQTRLRSQFSYNGIDRFDNNKGYVYENCRPCCGTCNHCKSAMTFDQFKEWVLRAADHLKSQT